MKLTLTRQTFNPEWTLGELTIDGMWECWTCEDTVRAPGVKVHGKTAIPYGTYKVVRDMSTRFGRVMMHVLDVPGFAGIRIHAGNDAADTEGCILVGWDKYADGTIHRSRVALEALEKKVVQALAAGEEVTIEVKPATQEVA